MKTLALTASIVALGLGASAAHAADSGAGPVLPPAYLIYKLADDGIPLRGLEAENGVYEARVEATDGTIVKVGIDPRTGEFTDAFSDVPARKSKGPAPTVTAVDAIQRAAMAGYWDVRELELKEGAWKVVASDDSGRIARVRVDGKTGTIQ